MSWERQLLDLFEDLEQQVAGLDLAARDAEVAELERAQYAEVELAARWHASLGELVRVTVAGAGTVAGRLTRVGEGWCLLAGESPTEERIVVLSAVQAARGLSPRALLPEARSVVTRLGLGSALRRVAEEQRALEALRSDGATSRGRVARVGADFLELVGEDAVIEVLPFAALAVLRPR